MNCNFEFFDIYIHTPMICSRPKGHKGKHLELKISPVKGEKKNRYFEVYNVAKKRNLEG